MTREEIWKDFFKKVIVPVLLTAFLFYWGTKIFTQNGETNYFYVWLFCGFRYPKNVPVADSDKSRLYRNGGNICRKYHSRRIDWLHCDYLAASRCGMVHSAYNIQACQGITEFQTQKTTDAAATNSWLPRPFFS